MTLHQSMENLIRKSICLGETFSMEIDFSSKEFFPQSNTTYNQNPKNVARDIICPMLWAKPFSKYSRHVNAVCLKSMHHRMVSMLQSIRVRYITREESKLGVCIQTTKRNISNTN